MTDALASQCEGNGAVPWHSSLRFRLVAAAVVIELVMLGVLVANSYRLVTDALESQTRTRLEALTPLLNATLAGYMFQRDHSEINGILKELVTSRVTDIRYMVVLDNQQRMVASIGPVDAAKVATLPIDTNVREALHDLVYDTRIDLSLPGNTVGRVYFGLSLGGMALLRDNVLRQSLMIAGVGLLLSLLLLISVGWLITRHLTRLLGVTRAIARGDYGQRIAIPGKDEIGLLAADFNLMTDAVQVRIADLNTSQEELRASESLLSRSQELGHIGSWNLDLTTNNLYWSDEVYRIFGFEPQEFAPTYKAFLEFIHPDDRAAVEESCSRSVSEGTDSYEIEHRILRQGTGEIRHVHERCVHVRDDTGAIIQSIGMVQDITERKKAEEALRESEATVRKKLKSIVEPEGDISTLELSDIMDIEVMQSLMEEFYRNTGILGAVLDLSGKIIVAFGWQDVCKNFHRCHPDTLKNCMESDTVLTQGVPPGTVRAYQCKNNMWDVVTPLMVGDRHIGNVFFGQFFYEGETPDLELFRAQARQHGFDETEYLAALARVPHFSREAVEAGLLFCALLAGIVTTLSYNAIKQARMLAERERLRKELITLNTELELKVEQRTAQLEASNQELEAFSYSVSHDLRAPLRHISGYVDLLNNRFREALPEKAGHYLSEITDSASQMGTLIDDLLQFSRTGRQELRQADLDMNAAVQEAIERLKPDTKSRNISWTVAELPRVFGDYSLLKQVWINLLENAVKYTQYKDEAEIEVGYTREADHWEFFVRDNGVGFDMRYAHKLFGVFQRLHSPAQFEGTGIGLANVQRIVHKHGGRVRAEGRADEGAAFYFTIPRNTSNERGKS